MTRIIAGRSRGRRLAVPRVGVRPTSDRAREALFSALVHRLEGGLQGRRVLDLFAGAGTLGLEALSRGAVVVDLVERSAAAAQVIAENLSRVGAGDAVVSLHRVAVAAFLSGAPVAPYDVVLLDPPYGCGAVAPTLSALIGGGWLAAGALIAVEQPGDEPLPSTAMQTRFRRTYGHSAITLLEI